MVSLASVKASFLGSLLAQPDWGLEIVIRKIGIRN
jgi:hypothetical protein